MAELNFPPSLKDKSLASSSTSAFDVFISCHGRDVRNTLASPLYRRLLAHGLRVFLDIEEFQLGHTITSQFEIAIQTASVYVAIFSRTYAQSPGCLDEVVMMLQSRKTILPIFYDVSPSELRILKMKKTFDSETIKEISRYDSDTLGKWRKALDDVANITGFELEAFNGDNEQLVKQVVERVSEIVKKPLYVAEYPTGLDEKVKDIERAVLEQQHRLEAIVIGIVGLGGVGKTTLAKEFFNRQRSNYERCCFLGDVRLNAARGSLNSLQGKLLKDLAQLNKPISTIYEGIEKLQKHLYYSHALIILDDVDCLDQLQALLLPANVLRSGSLILVTSRDKNVLNSSGIGDLSIYKLEGLNPQHSTELFCSHAFNQPHPVAGFEQVVNEFVYACGGLPLSLEVFGALLCNQNNLEHWKAQLRNMSKILPSDIQNSLKISYDSLHEEEKQIFLDIACFFIGEDMDTAIRIWDGSGWAGRLDLRNLEAKCIVEIDSKNRIRMHNHFRDLGRCIAEKESLGRPVRLWCPTEDLYKLYNLSDHSPVRGVNIVERRSGQSFENPVKLGNRMLGMTSLQLLRVEGDCNLESIFKQSHLLWLCWYGCPYPCLPSWIPMKSLRVLQVEGNILKTLWEDHDFQAPLQLRELNIEASLSRIPKSIGKLKHLEKFVLHMNEYRHAVDLKTLPKEFCYLQSLRHLELKKCSKLKSLPPSFGMLTDLKHFDLSGCSNLKRLPDSFGNLMGLQHIDLSQCSCLEMLPVSFVCLTGLQHIDLSQCSCLMTLPDSFGCLTGLQHIDLSQCSCLEMLPVSFGCLTGLQHIDLSQCSCLMTLPDSFGSLTGLQHIDLSQCFSLTILPDIFGNLTNLQHLHFSRCSSLEMLPESLGELPGLQYFNLSGCSNLRWLPDSLGNLMDLQHIDISGCSRLKMLPDIFGNLTNLQHLHLSRCSKLEMLPDSIGELTNLQHINLSQCSNLRKLPNSLRNLKNLRHIDLSKYPNLDSLPYSFGNLRNLQHINLSECLNLQMLPNSLENLKNLKHIDLSRCSKLQILPNFFGNLRNLQHIDLSWCSNLLMLPNSFGNLTNLQHVDLSWCSSLTTLPKSFGNLIQLKHLCLRKCYDLTISSETLGKIRTLEWIEISDCCGIEVLPPQVANQRFLREMYLFCPFLKELPGAMGELSNLVILHLSSSCLELLEIKALVSLEELRTRECVKLKCIQGLAQLTKLRRLEVTNCSELELLEIETLVSLEELTALDCVKLKRIQGLSQLTKLRRVIIDEKQL